MDPETLQTVLTPRAFPLTMLAAAAVLLLAGWVRSHVWSRNLRRPWQIAAFAGRAGLGFLTLLCAAGVAGHAVVFATSWRVWPLLLGGAVLIEAVLAVGRIERQIVTRRAGIALSLLRAAIVLAVVVMLCQPVLVFNSFHRIQRRVVVLLDVSASMQVPDNNLTPGEKVRLAEALLTPAAQRSIQLDRTAVRLREVGQDLLAQTDWLNAMAGTDPALRDRQLERNARGQRKALKRIRETVTETTNALRSASAVAFLKQESGLQADLNRLSGQLAAEAGDPLDLAIKLTDDWSHSSTNCGTAYETVRQTLQKVGAVLADGEGRVATAGDAVDGAFYKSLSEDDRKSLDQTAALRRVDLARRLMVGKDDKPAGAAGLVTRSGLLERLDNEYGVMLYMFGAFPTEWRVKDMVATSAVTRIEAPPPRQSQSTDLATTLEKVSTDLLPEHNAGIILLTDGRHNTAESVEPIARKLGVQRVPIFPVAIGGSRLPPTDAAVAGVDAPDSVSTNDRVSFSLDLKLDGLSGTNVTVTLFDGGTAVASNNVTPNAPAFRQQLLLSDVPKTNGLHTYRIAVETFPSEVDVSNNVCSLPVLVGSDPIKVLLIDGYPRWEFRYLKNMFMERDRNVRLQYVLFHPDQVTGITNRPPRAANAAPDQTEAEATLAPTNEAEWLKFDVIILGDVAPQDLGRENQEILKKYVLNRGGSLIVIAGSRHMPHGYVRTPLAEILPVVFKPSNRPVLTAPETEYRITLTAQGRNTMFMKLDDDAERNLEAWNEIPGLHWRHGFLTAKEGATVLAYATGPETGVSEPLAQVPDAELLLKQQQFERENALAVTHHAGFGSVLMFGFDQSWRLRYRKGDLYHHKFWGQILRWATADRIAAGASPLRIGTTRPRYPSGSPVRLLARLATPQFMPIANAAPYATIWTGDRKMLRRQLIYRPESPGVYAAEVDSLPEGNYRVVLETEGLVEPGSAPAQPVTAEFSVTSAMDSERVELAADRGLLTSVAALTAGRVLEPAELESVMKRLGPATVSTTERRQIDIWNSWPWLLLILALLTAEWVLRKRVRLP
jgi:hypothetical protein